MLDHNVWLTYHVLYSIMLDGFIDRTEMEVTLYPWNDPLLSTWETWWELTQVVRSNSDCYYDPNDESEVDGFGIPY